jgi:hypothetical protein
MYKHLLQFAAIATVLQVGLTPAHAAEDLDSCIKTCDGGKQDATKKYKQTFNAKAIKGMISQGKASIEEKIEDACGTYFCDKFPGADKGASCKKQCATEVGKVLDADVNTLVSLVTNAGSVIEATAMNNILELNQSCKAYCSATYGGSGTKAKVASKLKK